MPTSTELIVYNPNTDIGAPARFAVLHAGVDICRETVQNIATQTKPGRLKATLQNVWQKALSMSDLVLATVALTILLQRPFIVIGALITFFTLKERLYEIIRTRSPDMVPKQAPLTNPKEKLIISLSVLAISALISSFLASFFAGFLLAPTLLANYHLSYAQLQKVIQFFRKPTSANILD